MLKLITPLTTAAILLSGCIGSIESIQTSRLSFAEMNAFELIAKDEINGSTEYQRDSCAQYSVPKPEFCQLPELPLGYVFDTAMAMTWRREGLGDYTKTCAIVFVIRDRGEFEYALVTESKYRGFNTFKRDISSKVLGVATWDRSGRPSVEKVCGAAEKY